MPGAIQSLEKASRLDPHLAVPHSLLGFSYFQIGNFVGARRELEISSGLDPANAQKFLLVSGAKPGPTRRSEWRVADTGTSSTKRSEQYRSAGDLGFAYSDLAWKSTFHQMQTADPASYLVELVLGKAAEAKQVYLDAAAHYKSAIDKSPDNWELYYRYGHVLYAAGQLPDALKAFRQALSLNPFAAGPGWEAARILVSEKPEEAYDLVSRALAENPDMADISEALAIRGRALVSLESAKGGDRRPQEGLQDGSE